MDTKTNIEIKIVGSQAYVTEFETIEVNGTNIPVGDIRTELYNNYPSGRRLLAEQQPGNIAQAVLAAWPAPMPEPALEQPDPYTL